MADHNKGGLLSKAQKRLTRTKTKVLQNFGKAGKTSDEQFDEYVHKLGRQQDVATRLQKEIRNYVHCAKMMQAASKNLYQVLIETYEQDWKEETHIREQLDSLELMWNNYQQNLEEQCQAPLQTYISHFQPLKTRIAKRNRKLDYFDNAKHNCEIQQNAKKKDETKIQKATEEMEEAKSVFDTLNNDLHFDLPQFYQSRVNFYASMFSKLFNSEEIFHGEVTKLCGEITKVTDSLAKETESQIFVPRCTRVSMSEGNNSLVVNGNHIDSYHNNEYDGTSPVTTPATSGKPDINVDETKPKVNGDQNESVSSNENTDDVYENSNLETKENASNSQVPATTAMNMSSEVTVKKEQESTPAEHTQQNDENKKEKMETQVNGDIGDNTSQDSQDSAPGYPPPKPPEDEEPARLSGDLGDLTTPDMSLDISFSPTKDLNEELEKSEPEVKPDSQPGSPVYEMVAPGKPKTVEAEITVEAKEENQEKSDEQTSDVQGEDDNVYDSPTSNQPIKLPEGVLFQVQATHPYKNEDEDELTFEAGDIINVYPFDNPDDQDEGWLMGVKVVDGQKGVFPENFTKRL